MSLAEKELKASRQAYIEVATACKGYKNKPLSILTHLAKANMRARYFCDFMWYLK